MSIEWGVVTEIDSRWMWMVWRDLVRYDGIPGNRVPPDTGLSLSRLRTVILPLLFDMQQPIFDGVHRVDFYSGLLAVSATAEPVGRFERSV